MSQLSANVQRDYERGETNTLPVAASATIYQGSAIGLSSGYARQLVAGDVFKGFAEAKADNSGGSAGDVKVQVKHTGLIYLAVDSVAITDEGKAVYASDGATFTLTQSTNTRVGTVHRFVSTGYAIVKFNADAAGDLSGVSTIAGTLTGTVDGTIADIAASAGACAGGAEPSATQVDTAIATAVASIVTGTNTQLKELQTKVNELINALK